jgi:hypothetical protein
MRAAYYQLSPVHSLARANLEDTIPIGEDFKEVST